MEEHEHPRTNVPGTWRPPGEGPQDDVEVRFGYALKQLPALTGIQGGVRLRELRVTEVKKGWRVMFKGDKGQEPKVAYHFAETYVDALIYALSSLDSGNAIWHHDDYPPKRYDSPTERLRF